MNILTSSQMRTAEALCVEREGITYLDLMERAGAASAEIIMKRTEPCNALVVCGKGKNGGDGFVIARYLCENGYNVKILLACGHPKAEDSVKMFSLVNKAEVPVDIYIDSIADISDSVNGADIIVECVFGTGFTGSPDDRLSLLFDALNKSSAQIYSIDIPAGVNCDESEAAGTAVKADVTIAISTLKFAHIMKPVKELCGEIEIAGIGITPAEHSEAGADIVTFFGNGEVRKFMPARPSVSNKGTFGHLLNICGSMQYQGAAVLAAKGACRMGAGLVTAAFPDKAYPAISPKLTVPLMMPLPSDENGFSDAGAFDVIKPKIGKYSAVLAGCGIGNTDGTKKLIKDLLGIIEVPAVLDADGLNVIADDVSVLEKSHSNIVITPHPGEMSRLTGKTIEEIVSNPIRTALTFAKEHSVTVVLKGANTVVCAPMSPIYINSTGNQALAKGGSGDLLAGMIASLLAQGMSTFNAACVGVYLHGLCADRYAGNHSSRGILPSDLADNMSSILADF